MSADEKLPAALRNLVSLLSLRRHKNPYHVLLTSSISLIPDLLIRICNTSDWGDFRQYMQELSQNDRISVLSNCFKNCPIGAGYRAVASLLLDGYFSTIITTNIDSLLEDALREIGAHSSDIQVLLVGRDQPSYIVDSLTHQTTPITILKLYGSLKEGVLPESFPDVLAFPGKIEEILTRLLAHDLLIIGDLEHEPAIQRLLPILNKNALYTVRPYVLDDSQDYITRLLEARHYSPASFIVHGYYGNFRTFFPKLRSLLQSGQTTVVEDVPSQVSLSPMLHSPHTLPFSEAGRIADILLVTATLSEAYAVLHLCKNEHDMHFLAGRPYHDLGLIGNARVMLSLQAGMGAGGLGGTRFTISTGIQTLRPSAVIMVGIACGLRPGEQQIGDILVSERLIAYEPQRIGTKQPTLESTIHLRGERISAPPSILSIFKNGHLSLDYTDWPQSPQVFFGPLLSGDKLLDNLTMRDALLTHEPDALGLEMEGVGLYEVATQAQIPWLLVKAISDWGDGKKAEQKEQSQKLAAENAAHFTFDIIAQGGFAQQQKH